MKKNHLLSLMVFVLMAACGVRSFNHVRYDIDKAFADKYQLSLPFEFSFAVDHENKGYANPQTLKNSGVHNGVVSFAFFTDKEKRQMSETVMIRHSAGGGATIDESINMIKAYCGGPDRPKEIPPQFSCEPAQARELNVNKNRAVMCANTCMKGGQTVVVATYYVPHSGDKFVAHIDGTYYAANSGVKKAAQAPEAGLKGGIAYLLQTFEFK